MVTPIQLDAQGHLSLPPEVLAEAGFSRDTKLECVTHKGKIVVQSSEEPAKLGSFREAVRRMQELSKDYAFTTDEVMRMTRGED